METKKRARRNVKQAVPFFGVAKMAESLHFYVDGLGFKMTQHWRDEEVLRWCWLQLDGAALMLQEYKKEGHGSWQPEGKVGVGVTICFMCEDALSIYHQAKARGLQPERPFVGNAMWVTSLTDPDGYSILFESATEVPEGTVYTEPEA
jgi:catechol 2,3-dioxygenase-like lactoylglutathione lyase family enzyme